MKLYTVTTVISLILAVMTYTKRGRRILIGDAEEL